MGEDTPKYDYFRFGTSIPVRATLGALGPGSYMSTEAPNAQTGELELNMHFILRLESDDAWKIDETEFNRLLSDYQQKKTQPKIENGLS